MGLREEADEPAPAIESVEVTENPNYAWPEPPSKDMGKRRDNDYKNAPEAH